MKLTFNGHASRIASVADLRRNVAPFASLQCREIWVSMEPDGVPVRVVGNDLMQLLEHDAVYTSASTPLIGEELDAGNAQGARYAFPDVPADVTVPPLGGNRDGATDLTTVDGARCDAR